MSSIWVLGWLFIPQSDLLACELPPTSNDAQLPIYILDPRESAIRFEADARVHTFTGVVGRLSGRIRLPNAARASETAACAEVETHSITTGIAMRDNTMHKRHLHSDRFPTIVYTLSGVDSAEPKGNGRYIATLRGTLVLHGVASMLLVQTEAVLTERRLVVEGAFPLRLSTFRIPIPALVFIPMKDEVTVHFRMVAILE